MGVADVDVPPTTAATRLVPAVCLALISYVYVPAASVSMAHKLNVPFALTVVGDAFSEFCKSNSLQPALGSALPPLCIATVTRELLFIVTVET